MPGRSHLHPQSTAAPAPSPSIHPPLFLFLSILSPPPSVQLQLSATARGRTHEVVRTIIRRFPRSIKASELPPSLPLFPSFLQLVSQTFTQLSSTFQHHANFPSTNHSTSNLSPASIGVHNVFASCPPSPTNHPASIYAGSEPQTPDGTSSTTNFPSLPLPCSRSSSPPSPTPLLSSRLNAHLRAIFITPSSRFRTLSPPITHDSRRLQSLLLSLVPFFLLFFGLFLSTQALTALAFSRWLFCHCSSTSPPNHSIPSPSFCFESFKHSYVYSHRVFTPSIPPSHSIITRELSTTLFLLDIPLLSRFNRRELTASIPISITRALMDLSEFSFSNEHLQEEVH